MFKKFISALLLGAMVLVCSPALSLDKSVLFSESFNSLSNWRLYRFPGKQASTRFLVSKAPGGGTCLKAESRAATGLLISKVKFDVKEYPFMKWRWMVSNVYEKGDNRDRLYDNAPIRVSVLFEYDPASAGLLERMKYDLAKKKYGEYPPRYALNYIWASKERDAGQLFNSPLSHRSKIIALEGGDKKAGSWVSEEVNVLEDFKRAFGFEPPSPAAISIMNDSEKTKEESVSYLESIEVFKP
ncbi:MAG: DUF3047 domain-containing protein [Syntrophaceae bacterium]